MLNEFGMIEYECFFERRTSNVQRRMLKSLRSAYLLIGRIPYSKFDVGRSMFIF